MLWLLAVLLILPDSTTWRTLHLVRLVLLLLLPDDGEREFLAVQDYAPP